MVPEINYWAVLLATLSTLVVGSVWYTPKTFGTYWMRVARVDPAAAERPRGTKWWRPSLPAARPSPAFRWARHQSRSRRLRAPTTSACAA